MSKPPYGIASDIHLHNWSAFSSLLATGENSRLMITLNELLAGATVMANAGCERMYIAGDLFHVRGKITPSVLNPTLKVFKQICDLLEVRLIPGNHDLESDDSCELTNATQALEALGVVVCTEPTYFEDDNVLMMPWESSLSKLKADMLKLSFSHKPDAVIIHAPLNGVIKGIPDHGLEASELAGMGYSKVFCGHYHNRVDFGNGVWSIGALTHQTWNDVNTGAGFLIVAGDEVTGYETDAPKFVDYDESMSDAQAREVCAGNYVRVKLGEATEKEIAVIREMVKGDLDAEAVTIHAQPKVTKTERSGTIKSGESLEVSVHDFIQHSDTGVDKDALDRECVAILAESDNGEDD